MFWADCVKTVTSIHANNMICVRIHGVQSPMSSARFSFAACLHEDKIYVFGGQDARNVWCGCECFDINQQVWSPIAFHFAPGHTMTCAVVPAPLHTGVGAYRIALLSISPGHTTLTYYDPPTDSWTFAATETLMVRQATPVLYWTRYGLILCGGDAQFNIVDPITGKWTTLLPIS